MTHWIFLFLPSRGKPLQEKGIHRAYTAPSTVPTRYNITSLLMGTKAPVNMLSKSSGVCHYMRKLKMPTILKNNTAERIEFAADSSI